MFRLNCFQKVCLECPAGFYCPSPEQSPQSCPVGNYSAGRAGASGCLACPAGTSCLDPRNAPVNCDSGKYSLLVRYLR